MIPRDTKTGTAVEVYLDGRWRDGYTFQGFRNLVGEWVMVESFRGEMLIGLNPNYVREAEKNDLVSRSQGE